MPARIMRSLSIIHFSEGSSNWIMRQRNIGIIHYPEGIMNNRNNGYFGALFIIHFFYTQNEPPPPPTHTTTTTTTTPKRTPHPCSVSHIPVRSQTSRFGSGPSCPSRVPIPTARPIRPNSRVCMRAPKASAANLPRLGRRSHAPASLRRTDRGGRSSESPPPAGLAAPSTSSSFSGVFRLSLTFHA